ncbi:MAG: ATPase, T2SS/T4P/T4SS family [Candidatus Brocadiales bacterium]
MFLGERLIEKGLITEEQLEVALREQSSTGTLVGEVLHNLGFVSQEAITETLAQDAGVEWVKLGECEIPDDAIELVPEDFARRHKLVPISIDNGTLKVAMANIFNVAAVDELQDITKHYVEVVACTEKDAGEALNRCYGAEGSMVEEGPLLEEGGESLESLIEHNIRLAETQTSAEGAKEDVSVVAPIIRLMDLLITYAAKQGATDLHIEPDEKLIRSRYRIDGILHQGPSIPNSLLSSLTVRIKIMSGMNISESRVPQDGRIKFLMGKKVIDIRVSSFPTTFGETMALRLLDKEKLVQGLEALGFSHKNLELFKKAIQKPHGIILATGPTGSGKTTTLYTTLTYLNSLEKKIITVEDPVEYELPIIRQSQVNPKAGLTFAVGLRAILRQDPDIVFVGEVRDSETAEMAVRAALTGHLVFSTLHTNDAVGAIPRLLDMGVESFLLASSLTAVIAQRLARTICKRCKEETDPDPVLVKRLGSEEITSGIKLYHGKGCSYCRGTGYRGRIAVIELLNITPEIRNLIIQRADSNMIQTTAVKQGFKTLREDGIEKVAQGITTVEELLRLF